MVLISAKLQVDLIIFSSDSKVAKSADESTPSAVKIFTISLHMIFRISFSSRVELIAEAKRFGTGSRYNNDKQYASPSKAFVNPNYHRYEVGIGGPH